MEKHKTNCETVLNMSLIESLDSATNSNELQRTEKLVKVHHRDESAESCGKFYGTNNLGSSRNKLQGRKKQNRFWGKPID